MSIKMKYPLSRAMQDYPQNILIAGLEEALSNPIPYTKHDGVRDMTSRFSPNSAYIKNFMPSDDFVTLTASYKTDSNNYDPAIALDEQYGDLLQADCSCNEYNFFQKKALYLHPINSKFKFMNNFFKLFIFKRITNS